MRDSLVLRHEVKVPVLQTIKRQTHLVLSSMRYRTAGEPYREPDIGCTDFSKRYMLACDSLMMKEQRQDTTRKIIARYC